MKSTLFSLLLLLSSMPVLGIAEQTAPAPEAPEGIVAPAPCPETPKAPDPTAVELPGLLEGVVWLACTEAQTQECDNLCAMYPGQCVQCVAVCVGLTFSGCKCDWN